MTLAVVDGQVVSIAPIEWKRSDITLEITNNRAIAKIFGHEIEKGVRFHAISGGKCVNLNPNTGEIQPLKEGVITVRAIFGDWHLEITSEIHPVRHTPAVPEHPPVA